MRMHDSINELRVKHIKSHSSRTLTIEQQCNPENSLRNFRVKTTLKNYNSKESSDSTEKLEFNEPGDQLLNMRV